MKCKKCKGDRSVPNADGEEIPCNNCEGVGEVADEFEREYEPEEDESRNS